MRIGTRVATVLCTGILLSSCATTQLQLGKDFQIENTVTTKPESPIVHELYIVGDVGKATDSIGQNVLTALRTRINQSQNPRALLYAGDNIYPRGLVKANSSERTHALAQLTAQIEWAKQDQIPTYFIPGNHDWYSGLDGLMEQKDTVAARLGKKAFLPRKYSPIEAVELQENVVLVAVDSEWFLQDWNRHADINEGSEIRTREDFLEEFRSLLNKYQNYTVYVAIHHPVLNNGSHGGYFGWKTHRQPIEGITAPVLGSVIAYLRKFSGASPADNQFRLYQELRQRLQTMAQGYERVVFISGHDHNLQYIEQQGIRQLISGAGSKTEPARARQPRSMSIGEPGYAVLQLHQNGQLKVNYYTVHAAHSRFETTVLPAYESTDQQYPLPQHDSIVAQIYTDKSTRKSGLYRWLFGQHYRPLYSQKVQVPVANLATLHGGMRPLIGGGGMQSESLRMVDNDGKQWVLRALKKSPTRFIQSGLIKNRYITPELHDTFMSEFIADFYTATHPYMTFALHVLSEKADLYHLRPQLVYVPQQPALGAYNEKYGNALYMLEERPHKSQRQAENLGQGEDLIGTMEMLALLEKDEKYRVDTDRYIRARLFDFLIGDWDRHQDQWRWVQHTQADSVVFQPIPRDRDQAFAHLDGALLSRLIKLPALRHMQPYQAKFASPRWINKTAFGLDRHLLQRTQWTDWQKQAAFLQAAITDEAIDALFAQLPPEVQAYRREELTAILQQRRADLAAYARQYYEELLEIRQLTGTNKKDVFVIDTDEQGVTVTYQRAKKSGLEHQYIRRFSASDTREVWLYALDDNDSIVVHGSRSPVLLRLVGGRNRDSYTITSPSKVRIYDYRSKKNDIEKGSSTRRILKDNHALNQFDFRAAPLNVVTVLPDAGYNPDNGFMLGVNARYTHQNFLRDPFASQHQFKAKLDFAYTGFLAQYSGLFKNHSRNWYWGLDVLATNSNYTRNFFGWGNQSENYESLRDMDYHRVRTSVYEISPSYQYKGRNGGNFTVAAQWQRLQIEPTGDRLWDESVSDHAYSSIDYTGFKTQYHFANFNDTAQPTLGMRFEMEYAFQANVAHLNSQTQWVSGLLEFAFPLTANERITSWHRVYGKHIFGPDMAFYQAADLGANQLLRGYRQNRFLGESAAAYSTDLRWAIGALNQSIVPLKIGAFGGYDIGRVWWSEEQSSRWHQDVGGGIWLTALESLTLNAGAFKGTERWLFSFGLGYYF